MKRCAFGDNELTTNTVSWYKIRTEQIYTVCAYSTYSIRLQNELGRLLNNIQQFKTTDLEICPTHMLYGDGPSREDVSIGEAKAATGTVSL